MSNRLERLKTIEAYETRKIAFENVLKDMNSHYFDKGSISVSLQTKDFNKYHNDERIRFNNELFKDYIQAEIEILNAKINDEIKLLK